MEPAARLDNLSAEAPPNPRLVGIGGWLLAFCVANVFVSPALIAIEIFSTDYSGFSYADWVNAGFAAICIVAGIVVWVRARFAFHVLRLYFFVLILGPSIAAFVLSRLGTEYQEFQAATYQNWANALCWFLYFRRSERVQQTFGENMSLWPWNVDTPKALLGTVAAMLLLVSVAVYFLVTWGSAPNAATLVIRFVALLLFAYLITRR